MNEIPKVAELLANGGRCPICGYVYRKLERYERYLWNNGKMHRDFHQQHVPVPDLRLSGFPPEQDTRVDRESPAWLHQLVYQRAQYLQRQEHYDFAQWCKDRPPDDDKSEKDIHALLLVNTPCVIVGAASLSWIRWTDVPPSWRLNFIWIAGTWRRQGVLSKRWPAWKETYGAFCIETPWSESMEAFLRKMGAPHPRQAKQLTELPL